MPQVENVDPNMVTSEEQPQAEPQDVMQIVTGVQDGLMVLRNMLDKSPGVLPEDKKRLDNIISEYQGLIQENLSQAPGEQMNNEKPMGGQAPAVSGAREVAPVM